MLTAPHILWCSIKNLLWPQLCLVCKTQSAERLCPECAALLEPRGGPRCTVCDVELPAPGPAHRCGRCLKTPPPFERAFGVFDYAGPAGEAIRAAKYAKQYGALDELGRWLRRHLPGELRADPPGVVLPVPLHRRRHLARGFSAPWLLAQAVAQELNVPWSRFALRRVRDTPEQAGLKERERLKNVRGAFAVRRLPAADVLLVDDVITTGATVAAVAEAVARAGATRVRVLAAARVERP